MRKELKVVPYHCGNCSPLISGDRLFLVTGNGIDEKDDKPASPQAPSFIALDKKSGKLLWQNNMPGANILEGQWSNPALATVAGKQQIIFPGGDDVLYALEPESGKLIWKFQCYPAKRAVLSEKRYEPRNLLIGTPVVQENRLIIALGIYPDHSNPTKDSHVLCLDLTKTGDVSLVSPDAKAPANKNSASRLVLWRQN